MPPTDEEEQKAKQSLTQIADMIDQMLVIMRSCPYTDPLDRVSSLIGIMGNFEDGHFRLAAASAIDRLSRLFPTPTVYDIPNAEDFLIDLMASLIMTRKWAANADRDSKIRSMAEAVRETCDHAQLSMLVAVAMMRLIEGGQGAPRDEQE